MPYSPRWLVEKGRDNEAKTTLSYLRHASTDSPEVVTEFLEIKADFLIQRELRLIATAGKGGLRAALQPYLDLVTSRSNFHRLYIGCTTMFFQQFIGCNCEWSPCAKCIGMNRLTRNFPSPQASSSEHFSSFSRPLQI